ncbi:hypothetical protein VaNZ11_002858, partial [Volvox africanus]
DLVVRLHPRFPPLSCGASPFCPGGVREGVNGNQMGCAAERRRRRYMRAQTRAYSSYGSPYLTSVHCPTTASLTLLSASSPLPFRSLLPVRQTCDIANVDSDGREVKRELPEGDSRAKPNTATATDNQHQPHQHEQLNPLPPPSSASTFASTSSLRQQQQGQQPSTAAPPATGSKGVLTQISSILGQALIIETDMPEELEALAILCVHVLLVWKHDDPAHAIKQCFSYLLKGHKCVWRCTVTTAGRSRAHITRRSASGCVDGCFLSFEYLGQIVVLSCV